MTGLIPLLLLIAAAPQADGGKASRARAAEPMASWFADADYPVEALVRGVQGNVTFRLRVDETGRLRKCAIVRSAGHPSLDAAACAILFARGRFVPARDRAGRAVPGTIVSRVRWVMPTEPEPWTPFVAMRWASVLHATGEGALDCAVATTGAAVPVPLSACWLFEGSDMPARMRALHMESTLTMIYTLTPVGQPQPAAPAADHGPLLHESAARMSVAPDGRIADCRIVRNYSAMPAAGVDRPPDICNMPGAGPAQRFAPAPGTSEVRHIEVRVSLYFKAGPRP